MNPNLTHRTVRIAKPRPGPHRDTSGDHVSLPRTQPGPATQAAQTAMPSRGKE